MGFILQSVSLCVGNPCWWLRSPNVNNTTNFYNVNTTGTVNNNNNNASNSNGVCFGFCGRYIIINIVTKIRQSNSYERNPYLLQKENESRQKW